MSGSLMRETVRPKRKRKWKGNERTSKREWKDTDCLLYAEPIVIKEKSAQPLLIEKWSGRRNRMKDTSIIDWEKWREKCEEERDVRQETTYWFLLKAKKDTDCLTANNIIEERAVIKEVLVFSILSLSISSMTSCMLRELWQLEIIPNVMCNVLPVNERKNPGNTLERQETHRSFSDLRLKTTTKDPRGVAKEMKDKGKKVKLLKT